MRHLAENIFPIFSHSILTQEQKVNYLQDGFLILPNFIAEEICQLLIERTNQLIAAFNPSDMKTIFSTTDGDKYRDQYFLESGNKIRFFFEKEALDEKGNLLCDKSLSINKIGHALHDLDPIFNCFSRMHKIAMLVQELDIAQPLLLQSMYICKQPYIGGEVTCHQDNTFLFVEDQPVTGLWFALEKATVENGCLWAIPGGHQGPLKSRMVVTHQKEVITETYDATPWPLEKMVPLEVPRGSLIVLHGLLPHMSKTNTSAKSRHAYSLHIASSKYKYAANNWLQRPNDMPFRGFL